MRPSTLFTFGILGTAFGLICGLWTATAADAPGTAKDEKKADHSTIRDLRLRIMAEFHGRATDVFTSIPGFGSERMTPVYERIPWQVPEFSTNEIEVQKSPATPSLLKDVFAKSLDTFEKSTSPKKESKNMAATATKVTPREPIPMTDKARPGFGSAGHGAVVAGLQLRMLDLIGTLDPDQPKVYSGGKAFELVRLKRTGLPSGQGTASIRIPQQGQEQTPPQKASAAKKTAGHLGDLEDRPLDLFETAGLIELSDGKETFVREKGNVVRMMGALRASGQCLQCHVEKQKGDLLGAFSYTFLDSHGELKRGNKQP